MPVLQGRFQPIAVAKHLRVFPRACPGLQFAVATEVQDDRLVVRLQDDGRSFLCFGTKSPRSLVQKIPATSLQPLETPSSSGVCPSPCSRQPTLTAGQPTSKRAWSTMRKKIGLMFPATDPVTSLLPVRTTRFSRLDLRRYRTRGRSAGLGGC